MSSVETKAAWSSRKILLVAVVLSVVAGAVMGFATSYVLRPLPASQDRTFFLFTSILHYNEDNATRAFGTKIYNDTFAPDRITVNRGDRITIRYYNTEDEPEDHTFTMQYSSYNFDQILHFQETKDFKFTADQAGVFKFECTIHQPTMTGYLVVLG